MAKFYGNIGFLDTVETEPGIWEETFQEKPYYGDLVRNTSRWQPAGKVNDDISLSNSISIVADPYASDNFQKIRYVEFLGSCFTVLKLICSAFSNWSSLSLR